MRRRRHLFAPAVAITSLYVGLFAMSSDAFSVVQLVDTTNRPTYVPSPVPVPTVHVPHTGPLGPWLGMHWPALVGMAVALGLILALTVAVAVRGKSARP